MTAGGEMQNARKAVWVIVTVLATLGGASFFVDDARGLLSRIWAGAEARPLPSLMLLAAFVISVWLSQDQILRMVGLSNDRILKHNIKRWLENAEYSVGDKTQGAVGLVSFVLSADLYTHDPATGIREQINGLTIVKDRGSYWTKLGLRTGLDDELRERFEALNSSQQRRVIASARRSIAQTHAMYQRLETPLNDIAVEEMLFTQDGLSERELWEGMGNLKKAAIILSESLTYEINAQ